MKDGVGSKILAKGDQIPEKLGFVGLGIMGRPMARNLMRAGYELVLYNRTRSKAEELAAELGAKVAEIPKVARSYSMLVQAEVNARTNLESIRSATTSWRSALEYRSPANHERSRMGISVSTSSRRAAKT